MPAQKKKLNHKKTTKTSNYRGVYPDGDKWKVSLTANGRKIEHCNIETEELAGKKYDELALEHLKTRANLNFGENPLKKIAKRKRQPRLVNNMTMAQANKRVKFSIITKNKICAKQKWCCSFCNNLLSDIFIVDHIIPLFLNGSNEEYNLQALCPGCDRFKTAYIDHKILEPMVKAGQRLTISDILQIQKNNLGRMQCVDLVAQPLPVQSPPPVITPIATPTIQARNVELVINGITIKINV